MPTLTLHRGDTLVVYSSFKENDGTPKDMTGYGVESELVSEDRCMDEVEMTSTWIDITVGTIKLRLDEALTAVLVPAEYQVRIRVTDPAGDKQSATVPVLVD